MSESVAIFKLIVAEFPNSANAYDSLGEGYLSSGDTAMSLANYKKSLALNPDNFNAEDYIERIKNPNKKREKPAERFVKIFTPEQYKADLDQLGQTLTTVHPNALKFISKEAFWKTIEAKKNLITARTTYGEFAWHCAVRNALKSFSPMSDCAARCIASASSGTRSQATKRASSAARTGRLRIV